MSDEKVGRELPLMRQARAMTLEVQRRAALILREGITATQARRFIDQAHRAVGASGNSFWIVPCGRLMEFPHGLPGECRLAEGDVMLIDTGCAVDGHNNYIIRTYVFGDADLNQVASGRSSERRKRPRSTQPVPVPPYEVIDQAARRVLANAGSAAPHRA